MDKKSCEIIDSLGGTVAVSKIFKVTKGAVSQWRDNGIPEARRMYLELAFPEAFSDRKDQKAADALPAHIAGSRHKEAA